MSENVKMDWNKLSLADKAVLASIGITEPKSVEKKKYAPKSHNPITVERRLSTRNTAPDEYYVKINDICNCCKTEGKRTGMMTKKKLSDNFLSLVQQEVPEGFVFRQLRIVAVNCINCDQTLGSKTTEELVMIIKTLHNIAATKCLP